MQTAVKNIIGTHLNTIKVGIVQRMAQQRRNASGKSVASLNIVLTDDSGFLEGASSFLAMERGRGPGKVSKDFTSIIRAWIIAKGISHNDMVSRKGSREQGLTRLSGAIAFHIMKHGTKLHRDNGYNEIYTNLINAEVGKIENEISVAFETDIERIHQTLDNDNGTNN